MYLTDREIRARLDEFEFTSEHEHADFRFDADTQIGPCSIDLRLSTVYWTTRPRRRRRRSPINLDQTHLMELTPSRGWERHALKPGERITVRPGQMVLGRVSERFTMPTDCAGRIEGRSSYARLGLAVTPSGGFINPGWRGHMPLLVVNHSDVPIRIPVGTPLCQLVLTPLSGPPAEDYAQRVDRKYQNDQGGPSYWWRDKLMRQLRTSMSGVHIEHRVFDELDILFSDKPDEECLSRLDDFVGRKPSRTYGSADELLTDFSHREHRLKRIREVVLFMCKWLGWSAALAIASPLFFGDGNGLTRFVLPAVLLAVAGIALLWSVTEDVGYFLVPDELVLLRRERDKHLSHPPV
jgi:deoxycytidine triphosphate deaminase